MLTLLIVKFVTFTCNNRCRYVYSRCTFANVWNADHIAELQYRVQLRTRGLSQGKTNRKEPTSQHSKKT